MLWYILASATIKLTRIISYSFYTIFAETKKYVLLMLTNFITSSFIHKHLFRHNWPPTIGLKVISPITWPKRLRVFLIRKNQSLLVVIGQKGILYNCMII
ncbi:unnamed protein product [Rhizophagus irregularis]|nr:unnamed protein product [Rhizophagus irregularis]CAB5332422.1 unnamed protein product [Rhizophagus irregularis]